MAIELDHTIVAASDAESSARWLADVLGLPEPERFGHFWQVTTANGVDLDFASVGPDEAIAQQHDAFLISEADFDAVHGTIQHRDLDHRADPRQVQAQQINRHDGGRGVYFLSNDGHFLEVTTRRYDSGS